MTRERLQRAAIVVLALVLRLAVGWIVLIHYPPGWLFSKAPDLGFLAQSLNAGHGLSSPFGGSTGPTAFLAPGYPALLALVFRLCGSYSTASAAGMMGLQIMFALLTTAMILEVADATFGALPAKIAATCWAVSPPLLWLPALLWDTCLSSLLLITMLALALRCRANPRIALWIVMGLVCGFALLVNPSLAVALFAILGWAFYQTHSVCRFGLWVGLGALLVVFLPWPIRNARVLHAFIPLRSNFGYELWQGNHEGGSGLFEKALEPLQNPAEYARYASMGEVAYMRHQSGLATMYIREHPVTFLRRSVVRCARFWSGCGSRENSGLVELHAVAVSLLGFMGLVIALKKQAANATLFLLPILVFPLPYYITHPDFRFRVLLDPPLMILGAYAFVFLISRSHAARPSWTSNDLILHSATPRSQ
jgi:4-amino-4-deoxy-L-arabinose transferase-like glycosyltransferase